MGSAAEARAERVGDSFGRVGEGTLEPPDAGSAFGALPTGVAPVRLASRIRRAVVIAAVLGRR
jgi:hypothetical protein